MAGLTAGQTITPDKKNILVDAINEELKNLNDRIKNQQLDDLMRGSLGNTRMGLQRILNSILEKRGVITPDETTEVLRKIDEAKRQRLSENYVMGMRKGAFYILALVAIGGVIYWYTTKKG